MLSRLLSFQLNYHLPQIRDKFGPNYFELITGIPSPKWGYFGPLLGYFLKFNIVRMNGKMRTYIYTLKSSSKALSIELIVILYTLYFHISRTWHTSKQFGPQLYLLWGNFGPSGGFFS